MTENNPERIRLNCVSQTVYIRRERALAKTTGSRFDDNLFDVSQCRGSQPPGSTSHSRLSQAFTLRDHESPVDDSPETYEAQEEPTTIEIKLTTLIDTMKVTAPINTRAIALISMKSSVHTHMALRLLHI